MEKHYTFLIGNRVVSTLVFDDENGKLAQQICLENGYDRYIWLNETPPPHLWSTHNRTTGEFTEPTDEYLISIGILTPAVEIPTKPVK